VNLLVDLLFPDCVHSALPFGFEALLSHQAHVSVGTDVLCTEVR
jgi:hypothetical protein